MNAINNALAFPGAESGELVPPPLSLDLHDAIAAGVVKSSQQTGIAGTAAP